MQSFLLMHVPTGPKNSVAALELMRHGGVCYKIARLVMHELMEVKRAKTIGRSKAGWRSTTPAGRRALGR